MQTLQTVLLVGQVFLAIGLIVIILLQHGKGADAGAAFGSGSSSTVFGSRGSGNFLTKATTALAVLFLVNSLTLGYLAANRAETLSLMEKAALESESAPAADEPSETPAAPGAPAGPADEEQQGGDMPAIPAQ